MKILFVTDKFEPKPLANAICAQAVAEEFIKDGHEVHFLVHKEVGLQQPEMVNDIVVHYVETDLRMKLFYWARNFSENKFSKLAQFFGEVLSKTKKLLLWPFNPFYSFSFPYNTMKTMEKIHNEHSIDIIISVYWPFEATLAGLLFKKRHPEVKWCIYALDAFLGSFNLSAEKRMPYWLPKFLNKTDLLIYMKSRAKEFSASVFSLWQEKLVESDIPLLIDEYGVENEVRDIDKEKKVEMWVYAGTLGLPHYDATETIKYFLGLPNDKKRELHFYSQGKGLEQLRQYEREYVGRIFCHEYIPHKELKKVYQNADVLVSMKNTNHISAKIFEYISYQKKIVHFSGVKEDPNCQYIEAYSKGAVIYTYNNSVESNIEKLVNKLDYWNEKEMSLESNLDDFIMNRPVYTKNLIINHLMKER